MANLTMEPGEWEDLRINLYLARAGIGSRREADRLVAAGRVKIGGRTAGPGDRVPSGARVSVDGREVFLQEREYVLAVHKPPGVVCTTDRRWGDRLIGDLVDVPDRVFAAGRLDKASEGLILITNQGRLADQLMKAAGKHEKEYVVTIDRPVTEAFIRNMSGGVYLEELGVTTRPCIVRKSGEREFHIILTQGLNRQIRRMCRVCGCEVTRLIRIRIMNIRLGDLPCGAWRSLDAKELSELKKGLVE